MTKTLLLTLTLSWATHALWAGNGATKFTILSDKPEQKIEHFGASDAWSMQFVGLWDQKQQDLIADWLFSTENDANGKPKGIGLSVWRFNLGAGSAEQGNNSKIEYERRTECMLNADGTYNWDKQRGQRNFLKLARQRGVPYLLAFCNSAPVSMTENGLATNYGRGGNINLKKDCYDDFARYITTTLKGIEQRDGVKFNYVCPVNEPDGHWNWTGTNQEGSPATNREIARLCREVGKSLKKEKSDIQVLASESSDYRCLLGTHQTDWQRGYEIKTFFSKDSTATYLGNVPNMKPLIVGHSYWTNTPIPYMREIRMQLHEELQKYNLHFWQTELCIMGNDEEIGGGGGYDYSMKTALYVARVIHHDLAYAHAESWSWWRAIGGDYKDGLIRAFSNDQMKTGYVVDSKLLWTLGNYSRFIRPGAVRYDIEAADSQGKVISEGWNNPKGVMITAYQNTDGSWVAVAINYSNSTQPLSLNVNGSQMNWKMYRTSDRTAESLLPVGTCQGETQLAPRSVTTFMATNR